MFRKYRKVVFDVILNVVATALPLMVLQLIILPYMARYMGNSEYGRMLSLVSLLTVIGGTLGNSLNNIRLIKDTEYKEIGEYGDFSVLLGGEIIVSLVSTCVISIWYANSIIDIFLLGIVAALWTLREYVIVVFRVHLNFKRIAINNALMVIGYFVGLCIFFMIRRWQIVYVCGITASLIYIYLREKGFIEHFLKTHIFFSTFKDLLFLIAAGLMVNLLNYADRMLIYPMIGGTAVSIYYASSLFGKIVSTAVSPINAVVLSYISKRKAIKRNLMARILLVSFFIAIVGYVVCRVIARPSLQILYPDWVDESMVYVPIMTAVAMVTMISSVITPFVLRFSKMKWQLIINSISLTTYVILSISLYRFYGLMGFCYGILISNIVKLIILLVLGMNSTGTSEKKQFIT